MAGAADGSGRRQLGGRYAACGIQPPTATRRGGDAGRARIASQTLDCRAIYPDSLWSELTWRAGALLNQTAGPPATAITPLADALLPSPRVTCAWRLESGGGIVTTLAVVADDAATIADAALRGQGFTCTLQDGVLRCIRVRGDVVEEHTVRGDLWLSSMETKWHPEDYGSRIEAQIWG